MAEIISVKVVSRIYVCAYVKSCTVGHDCLHAEAHTYDECVKKGKGTIEVGCYLCDNICTEDSLKCEKCWACPTLHFKWNISKMLEVNPEAFKEVKDEY